MVGAPDVVQPWMARAARDSDACLWHVSIVGGARRRGCAAGGVSEFFNGPLGRAVASATMADEIDQLDGRLLQTLRENPRIGVIEVARRLGVARGTVQARLDKLRARGVITGFGPDIEPARMGYPVLAFVSLEIVQGRLDEAVE